MYKALLESRYENLPIFAAIKLMQMSEGLYTSPHLVAVRERIRINGAPISEETFTEYFFEVWDRLVANDKVNPKPGLHMTLSQFLFRSESYQKPASCQVISAS